MNVRAVGADTPDQVRVFEAVEKAARAFACLGSTAISAICNERRTYLLPLLNREFLDGYNLAGVSVEQAKKELETPFNLMALPDELVIDFSVSTSDVQGRSMGARRPTIWIYMTAIDAHGLFCPSVNLTVEHATLHEMLHICGDVEGDGIIRHNWSGITPIDQALAKQSG